MARSAQSWLDEYGSSHQNPTNKLIHWFCIPLIMLSLMMLLQEIEFFNLDGRSWHGAHALVILASLYYLFLSVKLAIGMLLISMGLLFVMTFISTFTLSLGIGSWMVGLGIFVIAWIFQFIGHKIEGKKPSFLKDIQFLLIGPMWLLSFIYQKLGIRY
jgi:uncharacterized membrane protein YGL010W